MRNPERIDPFLDLILPEHFRTLLLICWGLPKITNDTSNSVIENKEIIREFWKKNPDLRFSQVLINLGFPNIPGFWYYMEEDEILKKLDLL